MDRGIIFHDPACASDKIFLCGIIICNRNKDISFKDKFYFNYCRLELDFFKPKDSLSISDKMRTCVQGYCNRARSPHSFIVEAHI